MKALNFKKPSKTKFFWAYVVVGVAAIILAVLLAPFWGSVWKDCPWKNFGNDVINLIVSGILIVYLFGYLLKKIMRSGNSTIKILTIVEFVLLALVALGGILSQFEIIKVSGACKIFGLAIWCRGITEAIRGYFYRHNPDSKYHYPLWWFCVVLAMITFGTYAFAKPFITDTQLLWVFVVFLILVGAMLIYYGIMAKPKKAKKAKTSKSSN